MKYDFDQQIRRLDTDSVKWSLFERDVLPLWVADMDFVSPEPVVRALRERVEHGVFGYPLPPAELYEVIIDRMRDLYQWQVEKDDIVMVPGVVVGFNTACHMLDDEKKNVLIQTPVYPPFFSAPGNAGVQKKEMELTRCEDGSYLVDMAQFEANVSDQTDMFLLCNPHNPVGKVFTRTELEAMAEVCLKNDVMICSDEIHCDLIFHGENHVPIASIDREIAQKSVTLLSPSKTYNIAGLEFSVAIIQNKELREKYKASMKGLVGHVNLMGYIAGLAAYRDGQEWLEQMLVYLGANRDYVYSYIQNEFNGLIEMWKPQGTYLAWLDCRKANIDGNIQQFFLKHARVAMNDGLSFGKGGEGFVRLNFACSRIILEEALERMKKSLLS